MKKRIDWKSIAAKVFKSTQSAVVMIFVLTVAIGTYGIHLLNENQKQMEKQMMVSTPIMEQTEKPSAKKETSVQVVTEKTEVEMTTPEAIPAVTEEEPAESVPETETPKLEKKDPTLAKALAAPCNGVITRGFGITFDPTYEDYRYHDGVDYWLNSEDTAIYAAADGTVGDIVNSPTDGYSVTLIHDGYLTIYRNLTDILIETGEQVKQGETIGALAFQGTLCFAYEESSR